MIQNETAEETRIWTRRNPILDSGDREDVNNTIPSDLERMTSGLGRCIRIFKKPSLVLTSYHFAWISEKEVEKGKQQSAVTAWLACKTKGETKTTTKFRSSRGRKENGKIAREQYS